METFEMPGEWVGGGGSTVAPSPTTSVSESPSGLPTDEITPSGEVTESPTAQPTQTPTQAPAAATTAPAQAPRQPLLRWRPTDVATGRESITAQRSSTPARRCGPGRGPGAGCRERPSR